MAWENAVVKRNTGNKTVIMNMEDGPATLDNQLWMYVGTKNQKSSSVLERNGLVGGKLFFFRSLDPARNSEATFTEGTVTGEWVEVAGGGDQPEAALEAQADSKNAMTFIRIEDGAFGERNPERLLLRHDRWKRRHQQTGSSLRARSRSAAIRARSRRR